MNEQRQGPIFIVGAPRSGTTLLQYMLGSHPRISIPTGESHFIIPLWRRRQEFGDLGNPENIRKVLAEMHRISPEFIETDLHGLRFDIHALTERFISEGRDSIPLIIRGLFELNAQGEGKPRWGDKTPYYVLHIETLLEMFPDAQIIHIIRDARDCVLSVLRRRWDLNVFNTFIAAELWKKYVERGLQAGHKLGPSRYHQLRYEDLLSDPKGIMEEVCGFIGEAFRDSVINFRRSTVPDTRTPLLSRPLQRENQGRWRSEMGLSQRMIVESVAGDTLLKCGYEISSNPKPLPKALRIIYRIHHRIMSSLNRKRRWSST